MYLSFYLIWHYCYVVNEITIDGNTATRFEGSVGNTVKWNGMEYKITIMSGIPSGTEMFKPENYDRNKHSVTIKLVEGADVYIATEAYDIEWKEILIIDGWNNMTGWSIEWKPVPGNSVLRKHTSKIFVIWTKRITAKTTIKLETPVNNKTFTIFIFEGTYFIWATKICINKEIVK